MSTKICQILDGEPLRYLLRANGSAARPAHHRRYGQCRPEVEGRPGEGDMTHETRNEMVANDVANDDVHINPAVLPLDTGPRVANGAEVHIGDEKRDA